MFCFQEVFLLVLFFLSMSIPALLKASLTVNESSASSSLRPTSIANEACKIHFAAYVSTRTDLRPAVRVENTMADAVANPGKSGYPFDYQLLGCYYTANPNPPTSGSVDDQHFFLDQRGYLLFSEGAPDRTTDTPVE